MDGIQEVGLAFAVIAGKKIHPRVKTQRCFAVIFEVYEGDLFEIHHCESTKEAAGGSGRRQEKEDNMQGRK